MGNGKTTYDDMIPSKDHEHSLPNLNLTNLVFNETFEGEKSFSGAHRIETGYWDYALQYVTNPVHNGNKSARFEIREDQPLVKNGKRAEVTIIKGLPGNNMWYSFAIYFPSEGFSKDSKREAINQWYQEGSPATSLRVSKDRIFLETGSEKENRKKIDICFVTKNTWHEFVFHFIHSYGSDGLIEVWNNGKQVIEHQGGNMYDNVLPKWKIGIYKASFKYGTSDVKKRVLFVDNIKGDFVATVKVTAFGNRTHEWFRSGLFVRNDITKSFDTEPGSKGSVLMFGTTSNPICIDSYYSLFPPLP